jgi:hypothetical protein
MLLKTGILDSFETDGYCVPRYWYECTNEECESESPTGKTAEEAYKAAVKRDEEPNRVLTLEEVMADADAEDWALEWIEKKNHIYQCCPLDVTAESIIFVAVDIGIKDGIYIKKSEYGETWRCWRRKPTKKERENTPWEDEGR